MYGVANELTNSINGDIAQVGFFSQYFFRANAGADKGVSNQI